MLMNISGNNMFLKLGIISKVAINLFSDIIGFGSTLAAGILASGGNIELPFGLETNILLSAIIALPFGIYKVLQGYALWEKIRAQKLSDEQRIRREKHETDKLVDGNRIYKSNIKATDSQLRKIGEIKKKHQAMLRDELEEYLDKNGL